MTSKYFYPNGKEVKVVRELGKGGEGVAYLIETQEVLKVYKPENLTQEKRQKVETLTRKNLQFQGICLPSQIVLNERSQFTGYIMPKAEGFEMQTCIFNPQLLKQKFPNWTRLNLANLAVTILKKIEYLHKNSILIGDINPFNILVQSDNEVYFVDTDSYQVDSFPCPVGTVHFTPPEIQGRDYKSFLRTKEHEYFAVATLLFMTFLPGKSPYSFQGGGEIAENIKTMNFSYPLGDEDNFLAPQGIWEFIWNDLSFDLRKSFYSVFKENERLSIEDWIAIVEGYKLELESGSCSTEIIPQDTEKILQKRTLNMNRRDIKNTDSHLRISKTELRSYAKDDNFGVLELSTKAVKLLVGNKVEISKNGFNFDYFFREADKTETGRGLDADNYMDMAFYRSQVLPSIKKMLRFATDRKVDTLYTVATAAYRTASNRDEILQTIKEELGINVKILTKKEEALATLTAFLFCKPNSVRLDPNQNIIMIDQGGGSTEISLFRGNELIDTYSLNLGTTVLKTIVFKEATAQTSIEKAFKDSEKLVRDRLNTFYASPKSKLLIRNKSNFCVSVGSAITSATNKKGNRNQHGTVLTLERLREKIKATDELLKNKYSNILEMLHDLEDDESGRNSSSDRLDSLLSMRVGLPMFVEIMEKFHIQEVVVSGTGLWYGVYFEHFHNINQ